jgi:hypothetical protein
LKKYVWKITDSDRGYTKMTLFCAKRGWKPTRTQTQNREKLYFGLITDFQQQIFSKKIMVYVKYLVVIMRNVICKIPITADDGVWF